MDPIQQSLARKPQMQKNHSLRLCSRLALSPLAPCSPQCTSGPRLRALRLRPAALRLSPGSASGSTPATGVRLSHPNHLPNSATTTPAGVGRKPLAVPVPAPQHQCEGGRHRLLFAPFNCTIVARSAATTACCGSAKWRWQLQQ